MNKIYKFLKEKRSFENAFKKTKKSFRNFSMFFLQEKNVLFWEKVLKEEMCEGFEISDGCEEECRMI